jgi:hypothetical protein
VSLSVKTKRVSSSSSSSPIKISSTGDYNVIMSKNFGSIRVDFIFIAVLVLSLCFSLIPARFLSASQLRFMIRTKSFLVTWMDFSVTVGLLFIAMAVIVGVTDILILTLVFACIFSSSYHLYSAEKVSDDGAQAALFLVSLFCVVVPWAVCGQVLSSAHGHAHKMAYSISVTTLVLLLFFIVFVIASKCEDVICCNRRGDPLTGDSRSRTYIRTDSRNRGKGDATKKAGGPDLATRHDADFTSQTTEAADHFRKKLASHRRYHTICQILLFLFKLILTAEFMADAHESSA